MEATEEQQEEILKLVYKNTATGLTAKELFLSTTLFDEDVAVRKALKTMIELGKIKKLNDKYYPNPDAYITKAIEDILYFKDLEKDIARKETNTPLNVRRIVDRRQNFTFSNSGVDRRTGMERRVTEDITCDIARHTNLGQVAYALYAYRFLPYITITDLFKITKIDRRSSIPPVVRSLLMRHYAVQVSNFKIAKGYRWNDRYRYPFKEEREDDDLLLKIPFKDWKE
jgi:hypothetical protein